MHGSAQQRANGLSPTGRPWQTGPVRAYAPIAVAIVAVAAPESGQAAKPSKKAKAKAKRSKKKAKKLGKKGLQLLKKGKWDKAATAFRKAMKLNPESPKYPRGLGKSL